MRLYDISFFCEEGEYPRVHIENICSSPQGIVTVKLTKGEFSYAKPAVTFYLKPQDVSKLKNAFIQAYEDYERSLGIE
jgi:hypothetical protein